MSFLYAIQPTPFASSVTLEEVALEIAASVLPRTTTRAFMETGIFTFAMPDTVCLLYTSDAADEL